MGTLNGENLEDSFMDVDTRQRYLLERRDGGSAMSSDARKRVQQTRSVHMTRMWDLQSNTSDAIKLS